MTMSTVQLFTNLGESPFLNLFVVCREARGLFARKAASVVQQLSDLGTILTCL